MKLKDPATCRYVGIKKGIKAGLLCREAAYLKCARINCSGDGRRPTEAGFQERASNRPELLWSRAMVVSVRVKGRAKTLSGAYYGDERK